MNALLRKEIRLLLPSFATALALAFSVWLIPQDFDSYAGGKSWVALLPFVLCPAMAVVMALSSFGSEINAGTFAGLLSQPVSRSRIWWTKTLLLAVALGTIAAVWWFSFLLHGPSTLAEKGARSTAIPIVLIALAAFSGGLWTVLLIRQVAAAIWFTLLVPLGLLTIVARFTERRPEATEPALIVAFIVYAIVGFLWARDLFLRAQDVHWTGGAITMPEMRGLRSWFGWLGVRRQLRPRTALFAKELQLHQSQLMIAGMLVLLHLGVIAARKLGGGFKESPVLALVSEHFWIFWLVLPLLIGCAAVAEERKLGTLEAQLCLPVKRRTQFAIKFLFALAASLLLGVVAPVLLEGTGILPETRLDFSQEMAEYYVGQEGSLGFQVLSTAFEWFGPMVSRLLPFWPLLAISIVGVALSFYASTLTRSTLQSLAPAVSGIIATWFLLLGAAEMEGLMISPLWRGWLIFVIGVPVMTVALAGLTYWNFKRVLVGWSVWRRNGFVVLGSLAFVIVATTAVYHRAWELVGPLEPPHGPARLASGPDVMLRGRGVNLVAQLPGGRVWRGRLLPAAPPGLWSKLPGDWKMTNIFTTGIWLEGSNWTSVALCHLDVVGVKNDATLWVSEKPENLSQYWRPRLPSALEPIRMVQLGNDKDWKSAAAGYPGAFLLKTNGTLWRLGTNRVNWSKWPGLRAFTPERLGTDSDWTEHSADKEPVQFRKANGQIWVLGSTGRYKAETLRFDDRTFLERAPEWEGERWRSRAKTYVPRRGDFQVGVREDGTFRVCSAMRVNPKNRLGAWEWTRQDVQLGKESNWLAVAACNQFVVTLKSDGTLWKWRLHDDLLARPEAARARRLGSHSDWVAISGYADGLTALAADGSLWFWANEPRHFYPSGYSIRPLVAASRKPQWVGDVLGTLK